MKRSPFPGMDPYVEPHWLDMHTALVAEARTSLNDRLPDDLIASVEERVAIEAPDGEARVFGPDVRVFEPASAEAALAESPVGGAIEAPFRLLAQVEPIT